MIADGYDGRYGRFRISGPILEREPSTVQRVMSKCIITRAEYLYAEGAIEYEALSMDFDKVEPSMKMPDYDVVVNYESGDVSSVSFRKIVQNEERVKNLDFPK